MEGLTLRLPIGKAAAAVTRFSAPILMPQRCRYTTAGLLSRLQSKQPTVYSLMQAAGCKVGVKDKDRDKNEAAPRTAARRLLAKALTKKAINMQFFPSPLAQTFQSQTGHRRDIT